MAVTGDEEVGLGGDSGSDDGGVSFVKELSPMGDILRVRVTDYLERRAEQEKLKRRQRFRQLLVERTDDLLKDLLGDNHD